MWVLEIGGRIVGAWHRLDDAAAAFDSLGREDVPRWLYYVPVDPPLEESNYFPFKRMRRFRAKRAADGTITEIGYWDDSTESSEAHGDGMAATIIIEAEGVRAAYAKAATWRE